MASSYPLQVNELLGAYRAIPTPSSYYSIIRGIMKSIGRPHIPFTAVTCCQTNQQAKTQMPIEADSPSPLQKPPERGTEQNQPWRFVATDMCLSLAWMQNASKCMHERSQTEFSGKYKNSSVSLDSFKLKFALYLGFAEFSHWEVCVRDATTCAEWLESLVEKPNTVHKNTVILPPVRGWLENNDLRILQPS